LTNLANKALKKNLGDLIYFLGLEFATKSIDIHLCWWKYIYFKSLYEH